MKFSFSIHSRILRLRVVAFLPIFATFKYTYTVFFSLSLVSISIFKYSFCVANRKHETSHATRMPSKQQQQRSHFFFLSWFHTMTMATSKMKRISIQLVRLLAVNDCNNILFTASRRPMLIVW